MIRPMMGRQPNRPTPYNGDSISMSSNDNNTTMNRGRGQMLGGPYNMQGRRPQMQPSGRGLYNGRPYQSTFRSAVDEPSMMSNLIMGNSYNRFQSGMFNPYGSGQQDSPTQRPYQPFVPPTANSNPNPNPSPSPTPTPAPAPAPAPVRYRGQDALNRLGLNRALTPEEIAQLRGQGFSGDDFGEEDINRAREIIRRNQPGLLNSPAPTPNENPAPTPPYGPDNVGNPAPPNSPASPTRYAGQDAMARLGLNRALSGDEMGQLRQLGGFTGEDFSEDDINRARGLIRQHRPELFG